MNNAQSFNDLNVHEQLIFQSQLMELIKKNEWSFRQCQYLIERGGKMDILRATYPTELEAGEFLQTN